MNGNTTSFFKKLIVLLMWNIIIWKTQWKGKLYFGSNHNCGVMVLVGGDLEIDLISINSDDDGRSILL